MRSGGDHAVEGVEADLVDADDRERRAEREPVPAAVIGDERADIGGGVDGVRVRRVEDERRSLVIEKRGAPKAVLLSIRDYVRLAAPEPELLRLIGEESKRKGTDKLTSRQIDQAIKASRAEKPKYR